MSFAISAVGREEIPGLLQLIRELAQFERLEHEVRATTQTLECHLLGERPAAAVLLARSGNELAGYALYFFTFCSFAGSPGLWLDDLYVRERFRRQGLGRALIRAVAKVGVEQGCARFEWTALNWNESALKFYRGLGAETMDEWRLVRLNSAGLLRLAG